MGGMHMRRGGPGVHFSTGFGNGFQAAGQRQRQQQQRGAQGQQQQQPGRQQREEPAPAWQNYVQLIPFILIIILTFYNMSDQGGETYMNGENRYFSLTVRFAWCQELC
jgi:hypothetical protein